ncbi:MAG TPA: hypothetical protein VIV11_01790 [Kofleriaceae bacterium]
MRGYALVSYVFLGFLVACGGERGGKKPPTKPTNTNVKDDGDKPETEADREMKRRQLAVAIVPEGSSCLPPALKDPNAPRLELGASGRDALVCAIDQDRERLLGTVACWKLDVITGKLEYKDPAPLPGRGFTVRLDGKCARGYCLTAEPKAKLAYMATNLDGSKVAVLVDDQVHLFKADGKAHESSFTIRGDKGVTNEPKAVHFVAESILVEGADEGPYSAVFVFKADGTPVGPITTLGGKEEKPISTHRGSFSILDKARVGVAEKGMEILTTYDVNNGARAKLVRKMPKLACKPAELDAYWVDGDKVSDKCKDSITKASGHLMGGTVVAGGKSLVVLLRGNRLGEVAIVDPKSLAEKTVLKMPWCGAEGGGGGAAKDKDKEAEKPADEKKVDKGDDKKKKTTRGATQAESSDPQEGGE